MMVCVRTCVCVAYWSMHNPKGNICSIPPAPSISSQKTSKYTIRRAHSCRCSDAITALLLLLLLRGMRGLYWTVALGKFLSHQRYKIQSYLWASQASALWRTRCSFSLWLSAGLFQDVDIFNEVIICDRKKVDADHIFLNIGELLYIARDTVLYNIATFSHIPLIGDSKKVWIVCVAELWPELNTSP